jgi:thiamine biosynthesis lipoprotein
MSTVSQQAAYATDISAFRHRAPWDFSATGTRWRIYHSGQVDEEMARAIAAFVERDEQRWSRFRADSELSCLNRGAGGWQEVSAETFELLEACERWRRQTGGVFQPLIGHVLRSWGYGDSSAERAPYAPQTPPPEPVVAHIELDAARRAVLIPAGMALDLGGICKGWIAARVAAFAVGCPDPRLLVDAGGDVLAVTGEHTVSLECSHRSASETWVRLRAGQAVATSGHARRRWVNGDGRELHDLIDPYTGAPGPEAQATVVADDPVAADVLATVLALRPKTIELTAYPALVTASGATSASAAWKRVLVPAFAV